MSFPAYPTYTNSGCDRLGPVPDHWQVLPCRALVDECVEKNSFGRITEYLSLMANVGIIRYEDKGDVGNKKPDDLSKCKIVKRGDLVINSMNYGIGSYGLSPLDGICSPVYIVLDPKDDVIVERFVLRIFEEKEFQAFAQSFGNGILAHRSAIGWDDLKNVLVALPSIPEQILLASFLDHETARIDALIEEQQLLIELLKEKRQAVISHADTKGLDPTVPMKDSGVEWLGEVPTHWKQIRIKHILKAMIDAEHKTAEYSDDGEYFVCRTTNVRNGLLSLEGAKYADRNTYIDWTRRGVPEPLDILFTREAPAGEACLVPESLEICLGQRMVLFKLDKTRIDPAFTVHSIYAGLASDFVKQLSQGSTVSHFNMADIGNIPLFEPSLPEQKEISDFLAKRCDSYDLLINEAESSVKLISERRSALISAAVTGKIDVRGWQSPAVTPSLESAQEAV